MTTIRSVPFFLIDAFADRPFAGNPAAVCLLESWPDDAWLQNVAAEMNQSETAFLVREHDAWRLRWFTPNLEVDLCGHATLASAAVLWDQAHCEPNSTIVFHTRSGALTAAPRGERIELDFPLDRQQPAAVPPGLLEALDVRSAYVGRGRLDYLVEIESESGLRWLAPDFRALAAVDCRGVIVTSHSDSAQFDFVSRFFAPASGIDEDPVTGSAHCTLADFWHGRLGKTEFRACQASRRGGVLDVTIRGDRVLLGGTATIVAYGELAAR